MKVGEKHDCRARVLPHRKERPVQDGLHCKTNNYVRSSIAWCWQRVEKYNVHKHVANGEAMFEISAVSGGEADVISQNSSASVQVASAGNWGRPKPKLSDHMRRICVISCTSYSIDRADLILWRSRWHGSSNRSANDGRVKSQSTSHYRGVTRLDGARGRKQVWCPRARTWDLSEANLLHWRKNFWHGWDFSAPPAVIWPPIVIRRHEKCVPFPPSLRPCATITVRRKEQSAYNFCLLYCYKWTG